MSQVARLSAEERQEIFTETGVRLGIHPFHIEKDYWVCWTLARLFTANAIAPHIAFRGGTSLSKGWGLIQRFSEDIDLAMSRDWSVSGRRLEVPEVGASSSAHERYMKALRRQCREVVREVIAPYLTESLASVVPDADGRIVIEDIDHARDPFIVLVRYPETGLVPPSDYFKASVKIEWSGRADGMPMAVRTIEPYVGKEFPSIEPPGRQNEVTCVQPSRTFWEKIALIHEYNTRPERKEPGERYSRHFYDLHRLWNDGNVGSEIIEHMPMFDQVMQHRASFFSYKWLDHRSLSPRDMQLIPADSELGYWENDYRKMESMFFSEMPPLESLLSTLRQIETELRKLDADI